MSTGKTLECISPIEGSVYASRDVMTREQAAGKILVDVNHEMRVMREESFGPVVGIMKATGRGAGLSVLGHHSVTRPKSYQFRKQS